MTTSELRKAAKARIPDARVASAGRGTWTIRFGSPSHIAAVGELIGALGLRELSHDIEGSRWDWSYVYRVSTTERHA